MFTELYAVAKHTPLQISVSPDGTRLNVLIIPKPGDDAKEGSALAKPIQAIGTPEELDRELPAKLAEYCAAINDLRLKIDLPIEAITAEAGKGGAKKKANTPAARTPARVSAPKPKKKATPKPVKPARPARAAENTRRAKRAEQLATGPSAALKARLETGKSKPTAAAVPAASTSAKSTSASAKSKRATREECLADLRAYLAECESTSVTITRALFLSHNTTGRSYERKFKSWDEFLAEGRKAPSDVMRTANPGDALPPLPDSAYPPGAVSLESVDDASHTGGDAPAAKEMPSKTIIDPTMKWPFPGSHEAAPTAKYISRVIYLRKDGADDRMLGTSAVPLAIGDKYNHIQLGDLRVVDVEKKINGDERISVKPWDEDSSTVTARVHAREDRADAKAEKLMGEKPHLKLTADGPAPANSADMPK